MNCVQASVLLSPYLDRELDAARSAEVAAHFDTCSECTAALDRLRALSRGMHEPSLRYSAPAGFESKVLSAVRKSVVSEIKPRTPVWAWGAAAACVILTAALAWVILLQHPDAVEQTIADEAVASHIRSLEAAHLFDVPSTDRHTVKPWFDGKLDFSPDVKDLADKGFPLAGGRLDYIHGRTVAALVFHRRLHVINLFVWPATDTPAQPSAAAPQHGYNIVHWNRAGMAYWAVADIPDDELNQFAHFYLE